MAPLSNTHNGASSTTEKLVSEKSASNRAVIDATYLREKDAAQSYTTNADTLWRQLSTPKPIMHLDVYCLDRECEIHGRTVAGPVNDKIMNGSRSDDTARA